MAFILDEELQNITNIKVVGVGGGGGNAVNRMVQSGLRGIEFISMNTDQQALLKSNATMKVQLGAKLTKTSDSLSPLTPDNVEGYKDSVPEEEPEPEADPAESSQPAAVSVAGAVTQIQHGKVVISIKEGKDIYLELPI